MAVNGSWLAGGGNGGEVDVTEIIGDVTVAKALAELVQLGPLVSIGTTRDGGALGVTVTVDGEWRRDYFRSRDELLVWLAEAIPGVEALSGGTRPSAAPRKRQRRA
jgi:hypothetical protein